MAELLGKVMGNDGVARAVGQQAGKAVEGAVKKALGGNKQQEGEQKKKGGGGGGGGGFDVGDVLNLAGGNKNEGQGGAGGGMGNVLGGLFK